MQVLFQFLIPFEKFYYTKKRKDNLKLQSPNVLSTFLKKLYKSLWVCSYLLVALLYQNEERVLWKLGTLPPGLITFYGLTHPLEKTWHVLGLGYNPSIDRTEIENAAVIHYNGNMKPWLELAMTKYRSYWTKYIKFNHPYIYSCNLSE